MNPRQVHITEDGALVLNRLLDDGSNVLRFASGHGLVYRDGCKRFGWTIREGWAEGGFHGLTDTFQGESGEHEPRISDQVRRPQQAPPP